MSELNDHLYDDYIVDDDYHIEPYDMDNIHVYDYEPQQSYYNYNPISYGNHNHNDEEVIERITYLRDKIPFYGETTNQSQYTWKDPVLKKSKTSADSSTERPNLPFYAETTSRAAYSPKIVKKAPESMKSGIEQERQRIPFYSETTNRSDYVEKKVVRETPLRKSSLKPPVHIPFESQTSNMAEFTLKKTQRTCPAEQFLRTKKWKARQQNGHWWFRETYRLPMRNKQNTNNDDTTKD